MNLKEFFKPNKKKLTLFLVLIIIANILEVVWGPIQNILYDLVFALQINIDVSIYPIYFVL